MLENGTLRFKDDFVQYENCVEQTLTTEISPNVSQKLLASFYFRQLKLNKQDLITNEFDI